MQKRTENREQILRTFEDVPIIFARACDAIIVHPEDQTLRSHAINLFETLVDTTQKLAEILLTKRQGSCK